MRSESTPPAQPVVHGQQTPDGIPIKLYAASLSVRHGDTLSASDRKALATELVEENPEFNTVTLANHLAVSDETIRSYVGHILAKRREERAAKAERLSRLGWTQAEIATALGVKGQASVSEDLSEFQELGKSISSQLAQGHAIDEVATRHGLPMQLAWAIKLDGQDDPERMEALGINVRPYDVWKFTSLGNQKIETEFPICVLRSGSAGGVVAAHNAGPHSHCSARPARPILTAFAARFRMVSAWFVGNRDTVQGA